MFAKFKGIANVRPHVGFEAERGSRRICTGTCARAAGTEVAADTTDTEIVPSFPARFGVLSVCDPATMPAQDFG